MIARQSHEDDRAPVSYREKGVTVSEAFTTSPSANFGVDGLLDPDQHTHLTRCAVLRNVHTDQPMRCFAAKPEMPALSNAVQPARRDPARFSRGIEVLSTVSNGKSPGQSLETTTRAFMESRFRH